MGVVYRKATSSIGLGSQCRFTGFRVEGAGFCFGFGKGVLYVEVHGTY